MAAKPFTGRRAFLVIAGGFAIVFAVNGTMAYLAASNRPGLVVEDSYVAGQQFNDGLEAGRKQAALGWAMAARAEHGRLLLDARDSLGRPLTGLKGEATFTHPYGSAPANILPLEEVGDGRYATAPFPDGRWVVELRTQRGGQHHYLKMRLEPAG